MNTEPMNNSKGKDVIYIDIDDEITAIIDKVRSSHEKIVALVLPKRATAFQSIVNMKLLKRTADNAKKHLVLITSESGLLPLAGAVGIHVARTLQSKPEIPNAPNNADGDIDDVEETASMADGESKADALDASRPIGEFARSAPPSMASPLEAEDDVPIELDDETPTPAGAATKTPQKKNKKLKIPDFNKFRVLAALGALGLVVIILLWYVGFVVMPRATITIKTDSSALNVNVDATLDTDATEASIDAAVLPATAQQSQKTATEQAQATGEENRGKTASGEVKIINCTAGEALTIPAGTGVTASGLTFITQEEAYMPVGSTDCSDPAPGFTSRTVAVEAMSPGAKFNIGPSDFTVAGFSSTTQSSSEAAMAGGTDDIVKVLAQSDIDGAKQKLSEQDTEVIKQELIASLEGQELYAIEGTFKTGDPQTSANAKAGDEVTSVTVTQKTTYTMLGVKEGDLKRLVANQVADEIDPDTQTILDHGLNDAEFRLQNQQGTDTLVTLETTVIAGSDLDLDKIKEQVAGKKANDAKETISEYPGVTEVTVDYSPFWVSSIPKSTGKIKVSVEKPSTNDGR
jgi:hypothetical protein